MKPIDYARLPTEQRHSQTTQMDQMSTLELLKLMNRDDQRVLAAVRQAVPALSQAVATFASVWRSGGTIYLVGAGTSGRLAVVEAAECPPTFHTPYERVQGIMAGGQKAVFRAQEGSEDSAVNARKEIGKKIKKGDLVVGIAASGVTAFVRNALQEAHARGAHTVFMTCNPAARDVPAGTRRIVLDTGAEVLSGSTRLKAGTACKMALNMLTTAAFVRVGKTYGNRMVDLQPRSLKLVARGERLVQELGRVNESEAKRLFKASGRRAKVAIVMARLHCSAADAIKKLNAADGFLRKVIS